MDPRTMLRFRHADAVNEPKPRRPATVADKPHGGRYPLFYGSTFKLGGHPRGAIIADPTGSPDEDERRLADHLGSVIDERTYFHGSMMSETHSADPSIERFNTRFPNDAFDVLREQAEDGLLAFHRAWRRLEWISPAQRAFALNALWWELKPGTAEQLALTLLLCDGLSCQQISELTWSAAGRPEVPLLPRTRGLLARHRQDRTTRGERVFSDGPDVSTTLERGWEQLRQLGRRARPRVHLPAWSNVPSSSP